MTLRYLEAMKYEHLTAAGTAIARDGQAKLHGVVVNDPAATTLDIFNGPDVSSPAFALGVDCSVAGTYDYYGIPLASGLCVRLNGTADVTVIYE